MDVKLEIENRVQTRIPTKQGDFMLHYYSNTIDNKEHLALVKGAIADQENVLVRIHSECFTCDVFGSMRCDCAEQLERAMQRIETAGCGVLLYLRQEGRGIGLLKKLQAYNLQDKGMDTVAANFLLGHLSDEREYRIAALMLNNLKIKSIDLMTHNPKKIAGLKKWGINVIQREALTCQ